MTERKVKGEDGIPIHQTTVANQDWHRIAEILRWNTDAILFNQLIEHCLPTLLEVRRTDVIHV